MMAIIVDGEILKSTCWVNNGVAIIFIAAPCHTWKMNLGYGRLTCLIESYVDTWSI